MTSLLTKNIMQRINQAKLTISQFEREAGLKPSTIANIIHGRSKNPNISTLRAVAQTFKCSIEELLHDEADQKQAKTIDLDLCKKVIEITWDLSKFRSPTVKEVFNIAQEIYEYSIKNGLEQVDLRFAQWIVDKTIGPED